MAKKWVIVAETKLGSSDRGYDLRFWFNNRDEARAYAKRLGRAAQVAFMLSNLEANRRADQAEHDALAAAALLTLKTLDPKGEVGVKYEVRDVEEFVTPVEPPATNTWETMLRALRDAVVT